ncbi:titin-like [Lissotriton helveticus]
MLEPAELVRGSNATLQCEIAGTGPFEINWFKDKKQIRSSKKYRLTSPKGLACIEISSFNSADVGEYECVVANEVGKCGCSATYRLKEPPSFIKKIENVTAFLGNAVTFQAVVRGSEPISVTWMKGKEILKEMDKVKITFENSISSLTIADVQPSSAGKYTCLAENEAGSQTCFGELSVKEPARIVDKTELTQVTAGDPATLECTVAGTPELKTRWLRHGKELMSNKKYRISFKNNTACLKFYSSELQDSGEYTFEVSNDAGSMKCQITFTVLDRTIPPTFTKPLRSLDSIVSATCRLECKLSGSLPMSASWFKDGKEITGEKYRIAFGEGSASLDISRVDMSDAGIYTCRATNSAGSKESSGTLTVKEPPSFTSKPDPQEVLPGSTVRLKAAFQGTAPFSIQWFKGEEELTTGGTCYITKEALGTTLEIYAVKQSNSGSYACKVSNVAGAVACTANLFVKGLHSLFAFGLLHS